METENYIEVNGLHLYHELHGTGDALIVLHGGYGNTDMFAPMQEALSTSRQVIPVDLQGHGRTADIDRPLSFETMAEDIAALADSLHLAEVDLFGYSLGGGVALRVAIQFPGLVRKLILVSTPFRQDGWYPEVLQGMHSQKEPATAEYMKQGPLYELYTHIAPRPGDWPRLVAKMGTLLSQEYDWGDDLPRITAQTLLVYGDADSIRPAHAVEFFGRLGGGKGDAGWDGSGMPKNRLAVLPGTSHYTIFTSPLLTELTAQFLDGKG